MKLGMTEWPVVPSVSLARMRVWARVPRASASTQDHTTETASSTL